ncbi:MAG: type I polyketide synthase [Candidatus Omnitrophota bacterium]
MSADKTMDSISPLQKAAIALKKMRSRLDACERTQAEPIAIVGLGCRFPGGADDLFRYWNLLRDGTDAVTEWPQDRWDASVYYDLDPDAAGKIYVRGGGFLQDVDRFDPSFFGLSPREAKSMDPQQRLLLEVFWEALENAGQAPDELAQSRTGVFVGIGQIDYARLSLFGGDPARISAFDGTGNGLCFAAGRLSYILGLQGPNLALDTACSSSLAAVHLACQSLRSRESDLALAGGVQLILSPEVTIFLCRAKALSPDGRCKVFDAAADGYGRGEGCGAAVLKRLSDAIADGDPIHAIIRGSALNHGGPSSGLTVPNAAAQQAVIQQALSNAKIAPQQISYVEAHGTGTALGDPIEIRSLNAALGQGRSQQNPLWIGSVKANIGHLEAAAGIVGLIKTVLCFQHNEIPRQIHFHRPNPHIPWDEISIKVPQENTPWPRCESPRIAGVSSFGISGTNVHVILEEAPSTLIQRAEIERPLHVLTLSAKSEEALQQLAVRYDNHLASHPSLPIEDVCFTANAGRSHHQHRLAIITPLIDRAQKSLSAHIAQRKDDDIFQGISPSDFQPKVAFLFSGIGSQYAGMGRQLYETSPAFRQSMDCCAEMLRPCMDKHLIDILYYLEDNNILLNNIGYAQPALFSLEYLLAQLWRSWGIEPAAVMGCDAGECAAACLAGVFSLEDGLRWTAERARLMQTMRQDNESESLLDELENAALKISLSQPSLGLISSITGRFEREEYTQPDYWGRQACMPGQFDAGIKTLRQSGCEIFLEIGPHPVLCGMDGKDAGLWLPSLRKDGSDWRVMLQSLSILYIRGAKINWRGFDRDYARRRVELPTYPFQRRRYWVDAPQARQSASPNECSESIALLQQGDVQRLSQRLVQTCHRSLEEKMDMADCLQILAGQCLRESSLAAVQHWFYEWQWRPCPRRRSLSLESLRNGERKTWLIFADKSGLGNTLVQMLASFNQEVFMVYCDRTFNKIDDKTWSLDPSNATDFKLLFHDIANGSSAPLGEIVHLWSLDAPSTASLTPASIELALTQSCESALHLAKVLVRLQSSPPPRLRFVTRSAASVGTSSIALAQTPIWGWGKSFALEYPEYWGGLFDLAPQLQENEAEDLLAEIVDSEGEDLIALRPGQRFAARLSPSEAIIPKEFRCQPSAAYLITGGTGALGLHTAAWLAQHGARRLILTSRRGAAGDAMAAIYRLKEAGVQVSVCKADVSSEEDMARVFAEIDAAGVPLRGAIHAAGVASYELIASMDAAAFQSVLPPKTTGAWLLHQHTLHRDLDFFAMYSSIASVWGSKGQAHYAAANQFLDGLAFYRKSLGLPALTIDWGPWSGGGMAAPEHLEALAKMGVNALPPETALSALGFLLAAKTGQTVVADVHWNRFKEIYEARGARTLFQEIAAAPSESALTPSHKSNLIELWEKENEEDRLHLLLAFLQAQTAAILDYEPDCTPDPLRGFFDLGMDSLMAVELKNRLAAQLNLSLSSTLIFDQPNIRSLAEFLAHEHFHWNDDRKVEKPIIIPALNEAAKAADDSIEDKLSRLEKLLRSEE